MPAVRIIPCLDVADGQVVKGVQFRNHRVIGDIVEHALGYRDGGADELGISEVTAARRQGKAEPRPAHPCPFEIAHGNDDMIDSCDAAAHCPSFTG